MKSSWEQTQNLSFSLGNKLLPLRRPAGSQSRCLENQGIKRAPAGRGKRIPVHGAAPMPGHRGN